MRANLHAEFDTFFCELEECWKSQLNPYGSRIATDTEYMLQHYVPNLALAITKFNKDQIDEERKINLQGFLVGKQLTNCISSTISPSFWRTKHKRLFRKIYLPCWFSDCYAGNHLQACTITTYCLRKRGRCKSLQNASFCIGLFCWPDCR